MLPVTLSEVSVPTLVILGCVAVLISPEIVLPEMLPATMLPVTFIVPVISTPALVKITVLATLCTLIATLPLAYTLTLLLPSVIELALRLLISLFT